VDRKRAAFLFFIFFRFIFIIDFVADVYAGFIFQS